MRPLDIIVRAISRAARNADLTGFFPMFSLFYAMTFKPKARKDEIPNRFDLYEDTASSYVYIQKEYKARSK